MLTLRRSIFKGIDFKSDQQTSLPTTFVDGPDLWTFKQSKTRKMWEHVQRLDPKDEEVRQMLDNME